MCIRDRREARLGALLRARRGPRGREDVARRGRHRVGEEAVSVRAANDPVALEQPLSLIHI